MMTDLLHTHTKWRHEVVDERMMPVNIIIFVTDLYSLADNDQMICEYNYPCKGLISNMNPWMIEDHEPWFERWNEWKNYPCKGLLTHMNPWMTVYWSVVSMRTMTNIQILTIKYNKDEPLYTRWMLWIRWRYVPCRRAVTVNILFIH